MVLNTTLNNISAISWQSVILVKETEVRDENQQGTGKLRNEKKRSENRIQRNL